jgi:hypothetical protein
MSQSDQLFRILDGHDASTVDSPEAQKLLGELTALRRRFINAWHERAITLTREERRLPRNEVRQACSLLTDLTARLRATD